MCAIGDRRSTSNCSEAGDGGLGRLVNDLKRREGRFAVIGKTRFLKGGQKELSYFKEKARKSRIQFEVLLVQPGANEATESDDIIRLLATTELYLKKTTEANFRVVVNSGS